MTLTLAAGFCAAGTMDDSRQAYLAGDYARAQQLLLKAAEDGDPRAQHGAGVMYETGRGVEKDYGKAIEWYEKSAAQGESTALNSLAHLYYQGLGVKQNFRKAFKYYEQASEKNDFAPAQAMAWNNMANMYFTGKGVGKNLKKAAECYKKAADGGDVFAMNNMGYLYEHGMGVDKDTSTAASYYEKAAEKGLEAAEENLAVLRGLQGRDAPPDTKEAFRHCRRMASRGRPFAQYQLGKMYEDGIGTEKDPAEALRWYISAAENKFRPARDAEERLRRTLSSAQIEEAERRLKTSAQDDGHPMSDRPAPPAGPGNGKESRP